jgi:Tol biopolymer transport system component
MRLPRLIILLGLAALFAPAQALALPSAGTNAKIVFVRDMGGQHDIFIGNADGSGVPVNLTHSPADDVDPAVSPDGTRIAFASNRSAAYNIFVMNVNGTGSPIRLLASPSDERYPAWSADGNSIGFSEQSTVAGKLFDYRSVDASGNVDSETLVSNDGDDVEPAFSPDGVWVYWASAGGIWEGGAPSGAKPQSIFTPAPVGQSSPTWAPTSDRWAFVQAGTIVVQDTTGYSFTHTGVAAAGRIAWSPDGTRILFDDGSRLYTMAPDGSGIRALAWSGPKDSEGDWVPGLVNVRAPKLAGDANLGSTLVADAGVWAGANPVTYSYQWKRCNPPGDNGCQTILGATTPTYTTTVTDLNASIRVFVTATSSLGTATAASAGSGPIGNLVLTGLPTISGNATKGSTLTATVGDLGSGLGTAPLGFSFQWLRCDRLGDNCVEITAATNPTYVVSTSDSGQTLRVRVTATNSSGSATGTSLPSALVDGQGPINSVAPVIAGQPLIGQTLVATSGAWTGAGAMFAYQWQRCSASGVDCQPIDGATASSYVTTAADAGSALMVTVSAANGFGSVNASSLPTAMVGDVPAVAGPGVPASTVGPGIVGPPVIGGTLTATKGGFAGADLKYAYQWQRCDTTATTCTSIPGATKASYTPTQPDLGSTIRVVVTVWNSVGETSAYSDVTSAIAAAPASSTRKRTARAVVLRGTAHADHLVVKRGTTLVQAGAGNDTIMAADGHRQVIDCGAGRDTVNADRVDVVRHCEIVHRAKPKPGRTLAR